jgi:hypothetical protein
MTESQSKIISYAEIFQIAATHFFGDPGLIEFIPDKNNENEPPEMLRKKSLEANIRHSLLLAKHQETVDSLRSENDAEAQDRLKKRRDELQAQIQETGPHIQSEPQLREHENRFEKQNRAAFVRAIISNACADGKIPLFLNSELRLPPNILARESGVRFLPKESIVEWEIDGEFRPGIVYGDEIAVKEWLLEEGVIAGVYDTADKRKRKCAELLEARLSNPLTRNCSKEEHLIAIKAVIPELLRKEFESVRRALGPKFSFMMKPGRRPNLPAET